MKKFKRAKNLSLLLAVIMILQLLLPVSAVFAEGDGSKLEDVFTFDFLKICEAPVDWQNIDSCDDIENNHIFADLNVLDGKAVALQYKWDTIGKNAQGGDFAEIQIPNIFSLADFSGDEAEKLYVDEIDSNGQLTGVKIDVGTYSVTGGVLRLDFNDAIEIDEGAALQNGYVGLALEFNLEKFVDNVVQKIEFKDSDRTELTVTVAPGGNVENIHKTGSPDPEKDATKIIWTIDVLNLEGEVIGEASVSDTVPDGLTIDAPSFEIYDLTVGVETAGENKGEAKVNVGSTPIDFNAPTINGNEFELSLGAIAPYQGYRVQYETTIEDIAITEFTNEAIFSYGDNKIEAEVTVFVERSDLIEKNGEYKKGDASQEDSIDWWIDINKAGHTIDGWIVEDLMPTELSIKEGSLKVYLLTRDDDNNWVKDENEVDGTYNRNGFPVDFSKVDGANGYKKAYRIEFTSKINYAGDYQEENSFTNEAVLKDKEGEEIGRAEKTVDFDRDPIIEKTGSKAEID